MNPKRNQKPASPAAVVSSSEPKAPDTGAPSSLTPESPEVPPTSPGGSRFLVCVACRLSFSACTCSPYWAGLPVPLPVCQCGRRLVAEDAPSFLTPESPATSEACPGCGATDFPHGDGCPHEARLAAEAMRATRARQDASPSTPQPMASSVAPAISRALEYVATLRTILPTRAPTAEEMVEDPHALGSVLRIVGEELAHLDALLQGLAQGGPGGAASGADAPFCDELLIRGWRPLVLMNQPTCFLDKPVKPLRLLRCAVRLLDGLLLVAETGAELVARIDAVNAAAKAGTARPSWVPEGLTLDPDTKSVRWPEPAAPAAPAGPPETASAAPAFSEFCPDGRKHQPAPENPRRCVLCNAWPLVEVSHG